MSELVLPEGWVNLRIDDLGEVRTGATPPTDCSENYGGEIPFAGPSDLGVSRWIEGCSSTLTEKGSKQTRLAQRGDVLVSCIGILGKAGQAPGVIGFNQQINCISPKATIDQGFLFYSCGLLSQELNRIAGLQVIPIVNKSVFSSILVSTPVDIREQRLIAQILDTLDTTIRETEALIDKLKAVKQGLLHDLLTRGIDANGQLRPPQSEAPQLYKESPLGWIPREWEAGKVTNYLESEQGIKPGPFGSSIKKESYAETGFKVYGQEQVISGDQDFGDYFVPLRKYQELQDFSVKAGDVLISLVGTIGKVLVLKAPLQAGLINPRLMRLRPDKRIADSEFVGFLVASDFFVSQVLANAGGGTMPVINKRIISGIHAPVVPLTEQIAILKVKAAIDQRIDSELLAFAKLREQKSGLMDDLLTGRVRVTPLLESAQQVAAQTGA